MSNLDDGQGDTDRFPAKELERLYRLGGLNPLEHIRGDQLNKILETDRYDADVWYVVTKKGLVRL